MNQPRQAYQTIKYAMLSIAFLGFGVIFAISISSKFPQTPPQQTSATPPAEPSQPDWEGKPAPNFEAKQLDGKTVALGSLKGKVVFLNFWASWCEPCKEEMPSMQRLYQKMQGQPFEMVAVSLDKGDGKSIKEFLQKSKTPLTFPIARDPDEAISKKIFKTTGVPETFIIDRQGKIQKHIIGGFEWDQPQVVQFFSELAKKS